MKPVGLVGSSSILLRLVLVPSHLIVLLLIVLLLVLVLVVTLGLGFGYPSKAIASSDHVVGEPPLTEAAKRRHPLGGASKLYGALTSSTSSSSLPNNSCMEDAIVFGEIGASFLEQLSFHRTFGVHLFVL